MAQPTIVDLFGAGAALNVGNDLTIPYAALQAAGVSGAPPTAAEAYGAIVKNAHTWLAANVDDAVMVDSELRITAPSVRNGVDRTEFVYSNSFFADYAAPTFDPDQV